MSDERRIEQLLRVHYASVADESTSPGQLESILARTSRVRQTRRHRLALPEIGRPIRVFRSRRPALVAIGTLLLLLSIAVGAAIIGSRVAPAPDGPTTDEGVFTPTGSLLGPVWLGSATLLRDGSVLAVGVARGAKAEVWDPISETFTEAGVLPDTHEGHTATLLADGRVLVVGGYEGIPSGRPTTKTALWDPASRSFEPTDPLTYARTDHEAALLAGGRVLVVGGRREGGDVVTFPEIWDPATESFNLLSIQSAVLDVQAVTPLADGQVLVLGRGILEEYGYPAVTCGEIWDIMGETAIPAGPVPDAGCGVATATLLADGSVLVMTADDYTDIAIRRGSPSTALVWDARMLTFEPAGSLERAVDGFTATRLADDRVLLVGGYDRQEDGLDAAVVWDQRTRTFTATRSLSETRVDAPAVRLDDGRVLVLGGTRQVGKPESTAYYPITSAELFLPGGPALEVD